MTGAATRRMNVAASSDRLTFQDLVPGWEGTLDEIFTTLGAEPARPAGPAGCVVRVSWSGLSRC